MLKTCTVELLRPTPIQDAYRREAMGWTAEHVPGVLWYRPNANGADAEGSDALGAGDEGEIWFHWPKAHAASLAGCRVRLADGSVWDIVGDPHGLMPENTPGAFDRNFKAIRRTGAD